jgi:hypothetical protein
MLSQPSPLPISDRRSSRCPKRRSVSATNVLKSFNTWAFKREQPSDPTVLLDIISESIAHEEPVPFVLYWGKGPRAKIGTPDFHCLDYLQALTKRVGAVYELGAVLTLVFTDTHARLNGHSDESIAQYFQEIAQAARSRSFQTCWLGQLLTTPRSGGIEPAASDVPPEILDRLTVTARKWYHGTGSFEEGAKRYFCLNMQERQMVEAAFPRSIFITFNGSELRALFPDHLPIFYMYSLRRGTSVKPWFIPEVS